MSTSTLPRGYNSHLTVDQRRELLGLIEANPLATLMEIAQWFEARTGRPISHTSVRRVWVKGYRPPEPDATYLALTAEQVEHLVRICREAAPRYCRVAIMRRFRAECPRGVGLNTVRRVLRDRLGIFEAKPAGLTLARKAVPGL